MNVFYRNEQLFNRRSAVELYRILAAEQGVVNLGASHLRNELRQIASPDWVLHRTGHVVHRRLPPATSTHFTPRARYAASIQPSVCGRE